VVPSTGMLRAVESLIRTIVATVEDVNRASTSKLSNLVVTFAEFCWISTAVSATLLTE
jgi:hypothetical protein